MISEGTLELPAFHNRKTRAIEERTSERHERYFAPHPYGVRADADLGGYGREYGAGGSAEDRRSQHLDPAAWRRRSCGVQANRQLHNLSDLLRRTFASKRARLRALMRHRLRDE